ncbi:MAG: MarR family winged helix-turn-helix transcriptional regulator [Pseudomonadota bacterium]|nr:MarR family winged helix-turn-helix transcriptional regulator [Pseudomonadota bacterium]
MPQGCTHLKLRQLTRRVGQVYDRTLSVCGLKTTQYSLLTHIVRLGPVRPGELAQSMQMDASTLTRNLQPLVAQGWVQSGPGSDGRCRCIEVTAAGRAKRSEAQRVWKRAQNTLNERLGFDTVVQLHALIDDCLARMNDQDTLGDADE